MRINTLYLFFPFILLSCSSPEIPADVQRVLDMAGTNKQELEKIIYHYQREGDHEKLEAAYFLIRNMSWHYSYHSDKFRVFNTIFNLLPRTRNREAYRVWDSLAQQHGDLSGSLQPVNDLAYMPPDLLVRNINMAVAQWKARPWHRDFSNEVFHEFVLPYRCQDERLTDFRTDILKRYGWLQDSLKKKEHFLEAYRLLYQNFKSLWNSKEAFERYPVSIDYTNLMKGKEGTCSDEANLFAMILRSNGVPAAVDFTPQWANKSSIHLWTVALGPNQQKFTVYDEEKPYEWDASKRRTDHAIQPQPDNRINASHFYFKAPGTDFLPSNILATDEKKVTKVYRRTFSPQPELLDLHNTLKAIPYTFQNPCLQDVTSQYMEVFDIDLKIAPDINTYVFLCFFDFPGWNPIAFGKAEGGVAHFKNMGAGALYLPLLYTGNRIQSIHPAFILHEDGKLQPLIADKTNIERIYITRKHPLFANKVNHFNFMFEGRFEGANKSDFSDARTIHKIDSTPYYVVNKNIRINDRFKYVRYIPRDKFHSAHIAELHFFSKINGQKTEIKGKIIGLKGSPGTEEDKAFDNDLNTYYGQTPGWIGYEFSKPYQITAISYCPRNDTNVIIPGNDYELFYWDNRWVSLGRTIAKNYSLAFENVPKEALLWLHCHSGGKEERPFTYEGGKQVFY